MVADRIGDVRPRSARMAGEPFSCFLGGITVCDQLAARGHSCETDHDLIVDPHPVAAPHRWQSA